jgi:cell division protein FtsI/penicillin-binding protein 2
VTSAVAFSCNSYFRQLASAGGPSLVSAVQSRFGVTLDIDGASGRASPSALIHAYLEIARSKDERAVAPVVAGMARSAQQGTGKAAGKRLQHLSALAKTGTSPCSHVHKAPGDGFAVVMAPADHPRIVLLVCVHGKPGAAAADTAGKMLAALEPEGPGR